MPPVRGRVVEKGIEPAEPIQVHAGVGLPLLAKRLLEMPDLVVKAVLQIRVRDRVAMRDCGDDRPECFDVEPGCELRPEMEPEVARRAF